MPITHVKYNIPHKVGDRDFIEGTIMFISLCAVKYGCTVSKLRGETVEVPEGVRKTHTTFRSKIVYPDKESLDHYIDDLVKNRKAFGYCTMVHM